MSCPQGVVGTFSWDLTKKSPHSEGLTPGLCKWKNQYLCYSKAPWGRGC